MTINLTKEEIHRLISIVSTYLLMIKPEDSPVALSLKKKLTQALKEREDK